MKRAVPVLLSLIFVACGASAREKAVHAAFVTTNAARDAFVAWDHGHQLAIVDNATTEQQARTDLATYRTTRDFVVELFEAAYRSIAAAAVLVDDPTSLPNLTQAGTLLIHALHDATGGRI